MLMQNRIPYKISGGTSFFSRPEIKDLLAFCTGCGSASASFQRPATGDCRDKGSRSLCNWFY
jgi:superfamily I DNA/RNA helicase